jgi:ATP-dependent DNA ligase
MVYLEKMTELRFLVLAGTNVSDAGLAYLKGMTQLREVMLHGTGVTDAGLKKLQEALPKLKVSPLPGEKVIWVRKVKVNR